MALPTSFFVKPLAKDPNLRMADLDVSVLTAVLVLTLGLSAEGAVGEGSDLLLVGNDAVSDMISLSHLCVDARQLLLYHRTSAFPVLESKPLRLGLLRKQGA